MKRINEEQSLAKYREYLLQYGEELVLDGILFKGDTKYTLDGVRYREQSEDNREYEIWESSKIRQCFITMDQNSQGDPWDTRGEYPNVRYAFNRNLLSFTWVTSRHNPAVLPVLMSLCWVLSYYSL